MKTIVLIIGKVAMLLKGLKLDFYLFVQFKTLKGNMTHIVL